MVVSWNVVTGWPVDVLTSLRRSLSQYARYSNFKIGITGSPETRAIQYRVHDPSYTEMVVLYETRSEDFVRTAERILVEEYLDYCDNTIGGGGGSLMEPPYYLYIVR